MEVNCTEPSTSVRVPCFNPSQCYNVKVKLSLQLLASVGSTLVDQMTHNPKLNGLNPATADTGREKIDKK